MISKLKIFILIILLTFAYSCGKENQKVSKIIEKDIEMQMSDAYKEGFKELKAGNVLFAAKKFNESEILFPQSEWASKSVLMAAYAYYSQDYYSDAVYELKRFISIYPIDKNIAYAHFLLGMCYYEQIADEKKDLKSLLDSKNKFEFVIREYPTTDFALDATFKINLINDILASKEMYLGKYYLNKKKWIPAINRFKKIISDYDTTNYVEEALHRLVEVHYIIGLTKESEKYAKILGYNYQSSDWYIYSYKVFNKKYQNNINKIKKEKKEKKNNNKKI